MEQGGKDKCWRCGGPHKKKNCPNLAHATISNPNPNQSCSQCHAYKHDANHCFTFHPKLQQGQSQNTNPNKGQGFGKGQRGKGVANKRLATKLAQGQPNTMDVRFAQFEALITSMAT